MARVTVEDCLALGSSEPAVEWDNDKPTVVALREIAEGHVTPAILDEVVAEEHAQESVVEEEEALEESQKPE